VQCFVERLSFCPLSFVLCIVLQLTASDYVFVLQFTASDYVFVLQFTASDYIFVLQFTASDYIFVLQFTASDYVFVLQFTASDYIFAIFKLFFPCICILNICQSLFFILKRCITNLLQ
jgi:hypothetical protein